MYWLIDIVESFANYIQSRRNERDGKKYKSKEEEIEDNFKYISKHWLVYGFVVFIIFCIAIYTLFLFV